MSSKNKEYLKGRFANGCVPDETDFEDLLDSGVNKQDDVDATIPATVQAGHVPSSGAVKEYVGRVAPTKDELTQLSSKVSELETSNTECVEAVEGFQEELDNLTPTVVEGNVTNNADNEDLEAVNGALKLRNRTTAYANKGYVILRRNSSFASQVTTANTIYEVRYDFDLDGGSITLPQGSSLKFDGGKISNGTITGNHSSIIANEDICIFSKNLFLDGSWNQTIFYISWWDLYADGVNDDCPVLASLSKLISDNGNGTIVFPFHKTFAVNVLNGLYKVVNNKNIYYGMIFEDCSAKIEMNDSTIKMLPNTEQTCGIFLFKTSTITLENGHVEGDRLTRSYSSISHNSESANGIFVRGGDCTLENVEVSNTAGSGIYVGYPKALASETVKSDLPNIIIDSCHIHHIRKNGIGGFMVQNGSITNTRIENIGTSNDIPGINPNAGIDFEFEGFHYSGNIKVEGCRFSDCEFRSIIWVNLTNYGWDSFVLRNCEFYNGIPVLQLNDYSKGFYSVSNCKFVGKGTSQDYPQMPKYFKESSFHDFSGKLRVSDDSCEWENVSIIATEENDNTQFLLDGDGTFKFIRCTFANMKGVADSSLSLGFRGGFISKNTQSPTIIFEDSSFYNVGFYLLSSSSLEALFVGCSIDSSFYNDPVKFRIPRFVKCRLKDMRASHQSTYKVYIISSSLETSADVTAENLGGYGFGNNECIIRDSYIDVHKYSRTTSKSWTLFNCSGSIIENLPSPTSAKTKVTTMHNSHISTNLADSFFSLDNSTKETITE